MKYIFPEGFYADVRIEHLYSTKIAYTFKDLDECKEKQYSAAFIRLFDGARWYYASTSDLESIQTEITALAKLAAKNENLAEMPIYGKFSAETGSEIAFKGREVSEVPLDDKIALLLSVMPLVEDNAYIKLWQLTYLDEYKVKEFYSSKGADLTWDFQRAGFSLVFQMADGDKRLREAFQLGKTAFTDLNGYENDLKARIRESEEHLIGSEAVVPGVYPVILAPIVTGVFAHECFGHKSESDFMVGDEETKKEWALGKTVGPVDLTIVDSGIEPGMGYTAYDDEGVPAHTTYLIKNGTLTGRLHNAVSAADLDEPVTGNARAKNFEYEPLVRMTTTYIENGTKTVEELISETDNGIYIKDIMHGSGMSTFTLAPSLAYYIRNGKIDKPIRVSVVSGSVFEALSNVDGIANDRDMMAFVTGGCGKNAQHPLSVGFGGPHIRIQKMQVQ